MGTDHWNEELDGPGLIPAPRRVLQHEPFDRLEHKLRPLQTPVDGHLLVKGSSLSPTTHR